MKVYFWQFIKFLLSPVERWQKAQFLTLQ